MYTTNIFNELWYENGIFYQKDMDKFRGWLQIPYKKSDVCNYPKFRCLEVLEEIRRKETKKGYKEYVYAKDKNNKQRKIHIKKFSKLYP